MPASATLNDAAVRALLSAQAGAVSREQLLRLGVTDSQIRAQLRAERWQPLTPGLEGVYVGSNGEVPYLTRCWGFLLYAGPGAVLATGSAAWLWTLHDDPPRDVEVMVPATRRVAEQDGLRLGLRVHLAARTHPARLPPVTRLEDTVVDLVEAATSGTDVVDLITRACQRRLTTAQRLRECVDGRKKLRWRALMIDVLDEVRDDGAQSPLEHSYLRGVERPHGLPRGERNRADGPEHRRRYRDVRYRRYRLVVELDGRAAHPAEDRHLDMWRDNELVALQDVRTLRYGWQAVVGRPCECARQVALLLHRGGWSGQLLACGPDCTAV